MEDLQKRLRDLVSSIRRTPVSISDIIPILNEAADKIDQLEKWKSDVIDLAVVNFSYRKEHEDSGRACGMDIVSTEIHMALDPNVSPELDKQFELGWTVAAQWAEREDLISDIDSPAYVHDRAEARGNRT